VKLNVHVFMGILLENVAVLNDALQMTQNLAEPVSR
jgi:hypothetical protein